MIGAGCCMNREACLAGCPTISIYPDKLPAVDKFLINSRLMRYTLNKNQAVKWVMECINNGKIEKKKLEEIIKKFEDPYKVVIKAINMLVS
jgi:predicted glycosyltransferase